MGATMMWAREFEPPGDGAARWSIWADQPGVEQTTISGQSLEGLERWGEAQGIEREMWPFYTDIEADGDIDTAEVAELSELLSVLFQEIPRAHIERHHWALFVWNNILQHGLHFFVKAV